MIQPKTPMQRATKPMRRRNTKRRPPDLATAQREVVFARAADANGVAWCEMLAAGSDGKAYQHLGHAQGTAHIVRRHKCGDAVYDPDVAIAACRRCHRLYDRHEEGRFVADAARLRCFLAIRHAEVKRILANPKNPKCVPVDLSELLPVGPWTAENQYELTDAARKSLVPGEPR